VTPGHDDAAEPLAASLPARVGVAGGVPWLTTLVRLEIALWDRVDGRLRSEHDLPLAYFEALWFLAQSTTGLRVGELAAAMRITPGGTSKLADRIVRAGLIRREADPLDRRVSRLRLTPKGTRRLAAAKVSYEAELDAAIASLDERERRTLHRLVTRLLDAQDDAVAD